MRWVFTFFLGRSQILHDLCKVKAITILIILIPTIVAGQIPPGYYNSAQGLEGEALRMALHNIIDDHNVLSYNSLWGHMDETDAQADGDVWDIYGYDPDEVPAYEYSFFSDQCGSYAQEGDCYNREHSFPKSWFGDASPMNSDLFHIYPSDGYVNGQRSNLPYGEVETVVWESTLGAANGLGENFGYNGPVFEPPTEYKGDLARTYFYMLTRYMDVCDNWQSPMLDNGTFTQWSINTLIQWHLEDPVSSKEINRNNAVYAKQLNRNPFIDQPEWASLIWTADVIDGIAESMEKIDFQQYGKSITVRSSLGTMQYSMHDLMGRTVETGQIQSGETRHFEALSGHFFLCIEGGEHPKVFRCYF
jgi:endonuclease I